MDLKNSYLISGHKSERESPPKTLIDNKPYPKNIIFSNHKMNRTNEDNTSNRQDSNKQFSNYMQQNVQLSRVRDITPSQISVQEYKVYDTKEQNVSSRSSFIQKVGSHRARLYNPLKMSFNDINNQRISQRVDLGASKSVENNLDFNNRQRNSVFTVQNPNVSQQQKFNGIRSQQAIESVLGKDEQVNSYLFVPENNILKKKTIFSSFNNVKDTQERKQLQSPTSVIKQQLTAKQYNNTSLVPNLTKNYIFNTYDGIITKKNQEKQDSLPKQNLNELNTKRNAYSFAYGKPVTKTQPFNQKSMNIINTRSITDNLGIKVPNQISYKTIYNNNVDNQKQSGAFDKAYKNEKESPILPYKSMNMNLRQPKSNTNIQTNKVLTLARANIDVYNRFTQFNNEKTFTATPLETQKKNLVYGNFRNLIQSKFKMQDESNSSAKKYRQSDYMIHPTTKIAYGSKT